MGWRPWTTEAVCSWKNKARFLFIKPFGASSPPQGCVRSKALRAHATFSSLEVPSDFRVGITSLTETPFQGTHNHAQSSLGRRSGAALLYQSAGEPRHNEIQGKLDHHPGGSFDHEHGRDPTGQREHAHDHRQ